MRIKGKREREKELNAGSDFCPHCFEMQKVMYFIRVAFYAFCDFFK